MPQRGIVNGRGAFAIGSCGGTCGRSVDDLQGAVDVAAPEKVVHQLLHRSEPRPLRRGALDSKELATLLPPPEILSKRPLVRVRRLAISLGVRQPP